MRRSVTLAITLAVMFLGTTAAQATTEILRLEIPSRDFNPCTNEWVDSVVRLHFVFTQTVNDNSSLGRFHLNFSVDGVGETSGARYTGSEADNESFNLSLQSGRASFPVVNRFNLTTSGGGNNWVVRLITHVTVNANGEVRASFEKLADETCR